MPRAKKSRQEGNGHGARDIVTTRTLEPDDGRTTLVLKAHVIDSTPAAAPFLEGMQTAWSETLDRLGEHVVKE